MPCYTIQTCSLELSNADRDLLEKALKEQGYEVSRDAKTGQLSFRNKEGVSGTYDGKRLSISHNRGQKVDTDAIKKAYSQQVVERKVKEGRKKGWEVYREKGEYVFRKPTVGVGH